MVKPFLVLFYLLTSWLCACRFSNVSGIKTKEDVNMAEETKAPQVEDEEEEEYCDPEFLGTYEAELAKAREEAGKPDGLKPSIKRKCRGVDEWEYWNNNRKHKVGNKPAIISPSTGSKGACIETAALRFSIVTARSSTISTASSCQRK